jgi:hypothetical protein
MKYWWVNQNGTYKYEIRGSYLWSPKIKKNGSRNQFYENMERVQAGDIVFSFCDSLIKAVGIASGTARTSPKPEFGTPGKSWSDDGWFVPVDFFELTHQVRPKSHIETILPVLPKKYSPLQPNGNGLQSVYLAEISSDFAEILATLIGPEYQKVVANAPGPGELGEKTDDAIEEAIRGRSDIGATTRTQLIKARRGQGIFKANVMLNETACRVTGTADTKHLRASHMKPWAKSSDAEKLDGCNGLLLAPHIDHLFDQGHISFNDEGMLLISRHLDPALLLQWSIDRKKNVGKFSAGQRAYLHFHRTEIFEKTK